MSEPSGIRYDGMPRELSLPGGEVLRPFGLDDVGQLVEVVNADLDHLRPWMPWARQPVSEQSQGEFVAASADQWATGTDFGYALRRGDEILGAAGLHSRRGPGVLEIGYWIRREEEGRGLVTAAARRLARVAASYDEVHEVVICCDEANTRSAAVPRRLGFTLAAVEECEPLAAGETGWHQVWVLDADVVRYSWDT